MNRFLFLIGYRGTGKTTIGRLLAQRMNTLFIDADIRLEEVHGTTIRQIFAAQGEKVFRDWETDNLQEICQQSPCVVATGGGIVLRHENRQLLQQAGLVAWLTAEAEILWERIQADSTTQERRPNLAGGGLEEIQKLLAVREELYREIANVEIPVGRLSPEEAADAILAAWNSLSPK